MWSLSCPASLIIALLALPQALPDVSGTWRLPQSSPSPQSATAPLGDQATISVVGGDLIVQTSGGRKDVYHLDGSESLNQITGENGRPQNARSTATATPDGFMLTRKEPRNILVDDEHLTHGIVEIHIRLRRQPDGSLVVEQTTGVLIPMGANPTGPVVSTHYFPIK